jgi:flagellar protein FliO/FliZ
MISRGLCFAALLAFALAAAAAHAADGAQADYFSRSLAAPASPASGDPGMGTVTVVGTMLLAGAGGWLLLRGRKLPFPGRVARKLAIDETRSLGSRQYLVIASYEGRKMLLGVCPGRIDLLTALDTQDSPRKAL